MSLQVTEKCDVDNKAGIAAIITAMITDADKTPRFSTHDKASRYHLAVIRPTSGSSASSRKQRLCLKLACGSRTQFLVSRAYISLDSPGRSQGPDTTSPIPKAFRRLVELCPDLCISITTRGGSPKLPRLTL
jgi:hypothetical protein